MNITEAVSKFEFDVNLDDDEIVTDALILARVTRLSDGRSTFVQARSDGTDTVVMNGLIESGRQLLMQSLWDPVEDDE